MVLVETATFTRQIGGLLSDEECRIFQGSLAARPDLGDLIPGGGGIRKCRVALAGRGKRGGARVIYYLGGTQRSHPVALCVSEKCNGGYQQQAGRRFSEGVKEEFGDE